MNKQYFDSEKTMKLSRFIGNTPMIKISDKIYAKAEVFNPTGSIKDRPASYIINDAENKGLISKGDTIIEATSGNMGISFAWLAAERGYKCKIVMPSNMSDERKQMLRLYGAELIEVDAGDFDGAIELRNKLAEENGWFNCNQFENPINIQSHKEGTAKEIINFCENSSTLDKHVYVEALISGTGTGGTIMGCKETLSKRYPICKMIAVEPEESPVMSGGEPGLHGIQGIGDGSKFLVDLTKIEEVVTIKTEDAKDRARKLARETGIFVGISAGANILASERWVEKNKPNGIVVTFLCDRGERYFSCL
jgi:cysteine synthase A|tara:strand:- start:7718 stop:8641 length:924 start_codon:yes stop_codon:yes gene_type:complete